MTNPINYPGITINITNPNNNSPQTQPPYPFYQGPQQHYHHHCCPSAQNYGLTNPQCMTYNHYCVDNNQPYPQYIQAQPYPQQQGLAQAQQPQGYMVYPQQNPQYPQIPQEMSQTYPQQISPQPYPYAQQPQIAPYQQINGEQIPQNPAEASQLASINNPQAGYPVQYYLNNYNYATPPQNTSTENQGVTAPQNTTGNNIQNPTSIPETETQSQEQKPLQKAEQNPVQASIQNDNLAEEEDMSISEEIIQNLDKEALEEKEAQKKQKKVKIVALTNEYIMSLENYLNNPNKEVRLLAAKEVLKRLNEDRDRYDDAALNALINKMLQDPEKLVRIAALSALSSELASGNDYTIQLINEIQSNPKSTPEDVLEASNILLKMSATKETKYSEVKTNQAQPQLIFPS
ncbi:hypothetical protein IJD34_01950 [bacterium]|nr:hypothetical protein [bacterium]